MNKQGLNELNGKQEILIELPVQLRQSLSIDVIVGNQRTI